LTYIDYGFLFGSIKLILIWDEMIWYIKVVNLLRLRHLTDFYARVVSYDLNVARIGGFDLQGAALLDCCKPLITQQVKASGAPRRVKIEKINGYRPFTCKNA
jgi:hypothetical protein